MDHHVINNVLKISNALEESCFQKNESSFTSAWKKVNSLQPRPNQSYKGLHIFSFVLSRLRECLVSFLQFVVAYFFLPKGVWGLLGPLKSLCRVLAKLDKKALKYTHTGPFLRTSQLWLGGVLLVYERENSPSLLQKWNGIKAFVHPTMVRGISNSCRHLEELSHRSLSQILHNNHLNINSVLQLQR